MGRDATRLIIYSLANLLTKITVRMLEPDTNAIVSGIQIELSMCVYMYD